MKTISKGISQEKKYDSPMLADFRETKELCALLMQTPHYAKMGPEGIFAIVETAKSLGIDPRQALGGGLYYTKGKVEMSARMMCSLIRKQGHSITKDSKSDDNICILHGKRKDSGDCWSASFSIEEAKRAGLVRMGPWLSFPQDMLYARALSRLARQLFPDVIGSVYVEGEIALDPNINGNGSAPKLPLCDAEQLKTLGVLLLELPEERRNGFLEWLGIKTLDELTVDRYESAFDQLTKAIKQLNAKEDEDETTIA